MCRSNTHADVAGVQESTEAEVPFLGAIGSERRNPWEVTISLNKKPVKFQIDSGAEVTVVPDSMLRKLIGVNLKPTQRTLKGPTQGTLPVRGQFRGTLVFGDREVQQDIYVVKKLLKPLLGQPAIEALNLLVHVGTIADGTETQNPVQRFPQLFHGLGRMQGDYAISLKEGAVPFALTTTRRVPNPLMSSVKAELKNMATESRLESVRSHQESDSVCKQVVSYCLNGWPKKSEIQTSVKLFYSVAGELTIQGGLLMRGSRLVIPSEMQAKVLTQLHASHQGISKSRLRARQSVWWPGMSADLEKVVRSCTECAKNNPPRPEPLLSTPLPTLPWQRVGTDLFEWKGATYLLIVNYFSRWIEIAKLQPATSSSVIGHMQSIFTRYRIPEVIVSDNGPQYSSEVFSQFARDYGFEHVTSSPHYPQANGEAERTVKTVKALLWKAKDPYLALLAYRSTPTAVGYTPSELLMNRKLRTTIPISRDLRIPKVPDYSDVVKRDSKEKQRQAKNFNQRHTARELPVLEPGADVYLPDKDRNGTVVNETATRSYIVQTDEGAYRRNRRQIIPIPPPEEEVIPQSVLNPTGQSNGTAPNSNTSATADTTTQKMYILHAHT